MEAVQFLQNIVAPSLKEADSIIKDKMDRDSSLYSDTAALFLCGIAAQESGCGYRVRQMGGGPAISPYQIEPATFSDLFMFISGRKDLQLVFNLFVDGTKTPPVEQMVYNFRLATFMARAFFLRFPEPLPDAGDVIGYARLWKKLYNTEHGHGTEQQFIKNFPFKAYAPFNDNGINRAVPILTNQ